MGTRATEWLRSLYKYLDDHDMIELERRIAYIDNELEGQEDTIVYLEAELEKAKANVNTLNKLMREAGWAQGEIDTAACVLEEVDKKLAEAEAKGRREQREWKPISTLQCGGDAVLLFCEKWIDPDFNPSGIREGFRNEGDDGPIFSAAWNDCHDCWDTDISHDATHWMPRPESPVIY